MKRRSSRSRVLNLTVVASALAAMHSGAWADGEAAYTPSAISMNPGNWARDRGGDPALELTTWQSREALKLSITKPPGATSFNNWQGYSQKVNVPAATGESFLRGDLWIEQDWAEGGTATDFKNTGMWGSAMPEETVAGGAYVDAKAVFPIIHFTNQVDAESNPDGVGMLRIWDTTNSATGWIYLPDTQGLIDYGGWNTIDLRLVTGESGTVIEYYFNGTKVYTWNDPSASDDSVPEQFYAMYLKARNGDDVTNYDTYWSRLLGGTVYQDGRIDADVAGDVLLDSGASVTVAPGVTIDGNLVLEADASADGGSAASRARVNDNILVGSHAVLSGYWTLPTGNVVATGDAILQGADISGANTNLVNVAEGAKARIADSVLRNNLDHPTGRNGRTVLVTGAGSEVLIENSALELQAYSTNAGTDYGHAFTAAVGASNGGHAEIVGGSIKAEGSKRTVALHAIDGGSIRASGGLAIDTYNHFGHAVNAYSNPGAEPVDTVVELDGVTIATHGDTYSVGIQSANLGAQVIASDTGISTSGTGSFGVEVFNGATLSYTGGSIATEGAGAAGVRTYGGARGSGVSTVTGTAITTEGQAAAGVLAGDAAEPTAGVVAVAGATVLTKGEASFGIDSGYGSSVTVTDTEIVTEGAGAHGLRAHEAGGIAVEGGSITTSGAGASGVYLEDNASVTLDGVAVSAAAASITSQLNTAGQVQHITVGSGADLTVNNGTLLQVNRGGDAMDGIVNLTLEAGSVARGDVIDLDGLVAGGPNERAEGGRTHFILEAGSQWSGRVHGINDATIGDGASFENEGGEPVEGDVVGGEGSTIVFTEDATVTGSVQTGAGTSTAIGGDATIGGDFQAGEGNATSIQGNATIGGSFQTGTSSTTTIVGSADISGNLEAGAGASTTVGGDAHIGGGIQAGTGSTTTFNGSTQVAGPVVGTSAAFVFQGPASFSDSISGTGTSFVFSPTAGVPVTIQGGVTLADASSIQGGTKETPISVVGDMAASSGSSIGGNIDVQGEFSATDSVVGAGNSIGTISADTFGSLSGTRIDVEVNEAGEADLLVVRNGDVDLAGASLRVDQENGTGGYRLKHDYTIIEAQGGEVVNTFDAAALGASFDGTLVVLDPVKYGASDVKISLSVNEEAVSDRSGLSGNQSATLDGVLSAAGGNAVADATLQMQEAERSAALNQLSGEVHGSTQGALMQAGGLVSRTLAQRVRGNLGAGLLPGEPVAANAAGAPVGALPRSGAYPLWAQVVGNWGRQDADGNAAKARTRFGGLFLGGDTALQGGWRIGGALGYTDGRVEVDDRSSTSKVDSYTAALYGGNSWEHSGGRLNLLAGIAYTRHDIESSRSVTVGGSQTLRADYKAGATQLFAELGYAVPLSARAEVEPYAAFSWLSQKTDAFAESGGSAALASSGQTDELPVFTLGVRGTMRIDTGATKGRVSAGVGWRHASGDVDASRKMSFVEGGGSQFAVAGAPLARNAALLELGSEFEVGRNAAFGLGYNGQFGDGNASHTGSVFFRKRF